MKRFTPEFRAEAVHLAQTSGHSHREVAADFGIGLSTLRRRYLEQHDGIADLDALIRTHRRRVRPRARGAELDRTKRVMQLLLTTGDNTKRLCSGAGFAALCGLSLDPASSGKTVRHRFSRSGDRAANSALASSSSDG